MRQLTVESDAPEVMRFFSIAAAGRKTSKAPQHMTESKARCESIAGAQRRHVAAPHVPGRYEKCADQAAGKNSSRLESVEAEDLAPVAGVSIPLVDDEQYLGAKNPRQNDQDAQVPGIIAIDALLFGIAYADPEPDQYARCDQQTIGRQTETANVEESGEHVRLDAPNVVCAN